MIKIHPIEINCKQSEELLHKGVEGENLLSAILEIGMQIIIHEMPESEVTEILQPWHYKRICLNMICPWLEITFTANKEVQFLL